MALIEPKTRILEDGTEELLDQGEARVDEEGVEYADLSADPTNTVEEKPADDKPAPAAAETKPAADTAAADEDIPAPLKGKTPGQLAKMYQEAQALIGRQGQELGSYRSKFDQFIQADLAARTAAAKAAAAASPKPAEKEMTQEEREAAFFAKPHDAVAQAIENHPIIKKISETLGTQARDQAVANMKAAEKKFYDTHPDAGQIVQDEAFVEWVKASPVRQELMARAHKRYDFSAGHEVLSTWKALQGVKPKADTAAEDEAAAASAAAATLAKRKATLKAAGVPTAGNGGGANAPAGKSGKIFRRADIIDLMENNPERYEAMIDEIQLAYAEKRVR